MVLSINFAQRGVVGRVFQVQEGGIRFYNYRMVQPTEWVLAILVYIRNLKSSMYYWPSFLSQLASLYVEKDHFGKFSLFMHRKGLCCGLVVLWSSHMSLSV